MKWQRAAFWCSIALAATSGLTLCYLNIRYYIMDELTAGAFLKGYWILLTASFLWTLVFGAMALKLDEEIKG